MLRDVAYFMQATEKGLAGNLISYGDLKTVLIKYLKNMDVNPARTPIQYLKFLNIGLGSKC